MFILIYRAGLNPVFTIKIVLKWPNNHFNSILLIWQCSICAEIHWKYFERHNLRIFTAPEIHVFGKAVEKKTEVGNFWVWMFEMKLKISSPSWKYRIQNFPTSIGTFQRNEVSNANFLFSDFSILSFPTSHFFQPHFSTTCIRIFYRGARLEYLTLYF